MRTWALKIRVAIGFRLVTVTLTLTLILTLVLAETEARYLRQLLHAGPPESIESIESVESVESVTSMAQRRGGFEEASEEVWGGRFCERERAWAWALSCERV